MIRYTKNFWHRLKQAWLVLTDSQHILLSCKGEAITPYAHNMDEGHQYALISALHGYNEEEMASMRKLEQLIVDALKNEDVS